MPLTLHVNGVPHQVDAPPDTPLLYVLRDDLALNSPKFGCGLGQCGACTVQVGTDAVRSCTMPVSAVGDKHVRTVEGLGTADNPHFLQSAFVMEQAGQCGYCLSGMMMTTAVFLERRAHEYMLQEVKNEKHGNEPPLTDGEIRTALEGNLCRCGSHLRIIRAVQQAQKMFEAGERAAEKNRRQEHFGGRPR